MTLQVLIIADDLTGALDAAAPFSGARITVARTPSALLSALRGGAEVVSVSTGTRERTEAEVAKVMSELCDTIASHRATVPPFRLFKKIDSRLKGHIAIESLAVARAAGTPGILLAPAIPDMGRIVRAGAVTGQGVVTPIPLAPYAQALTPHDTLAPDTQDDASLDQLLSDHPDRLLVGARGLAAALARAMGLSGPAPRLTPGGPLLIAIGSRDPVTAAQIAALPADVTTIDAPDGMIARVDIPAETRTLLIRMTGSGKDPVAGTRFATGIANLATNFAPGQMLCCGGETAGAILEAFDLPTLATLGEPLPGVPMSQVNFPWGPVQLMTKSGGFGPPDLLSRIAQMIEPRPIADYKYENARE